MGKEVPDSVRSEKMAAFLLKNGIAVKIEDLNPHWGVWDRNNMYFIWRNMRKKRLATIVNILSKIHVRLEYVGKPTQQLIWGSNVELSETRPYIPSTRPSRQGQRGKTCPHCGYIDPARGASKCPNCDEYHS